MPVGQSPKENDKLVDPYSENEDWSDEEEDENWHERSDIRWMCVGIFLLSLVAAAFVHSLSSGASSDKGVSNVNPQYAPVTPVFDQPTAVPLVVETTTKNPLMPDVDMNNNNLCLDSEEEYGNLCYKKCSLLTAGTNPIRTSSWTCCENHPCGVSNQKGEAGSKIMCSGFDVGGDGGCPHQPGACLMNEELFLGTCFQKCALLTGNKYSNRVGPATCCAEEGTGCLDIWKDATSSLFNAGGGGTDNDASTPGGPHPPLTNLTEEGGRISSDSVSTSSPPVGPVVWGGHFGGNGNRCLEDEELYAGLCYKQCSVMTNGMYPIRTSTWTCCANQPCGISNQKGSVGSTLACSGFGIGGSGAFNLGKLPCPHKPRACNETEDEVMGMCYASCGSLTNDRFPHRLTAYTCCSADALKACLSFEATSTSPDYAVSAE